MGDAEVPSQGRSRAVEVPQTRFNAIASGCCTMGSRPPNLRYWRSRREHRLMPRSRRPAWLNDRAWKMFETVFAVGACAMSAARRRLTIARQ